MGPRCVGDASAERQRVGSRLQERLEAQRIRVFQGRLGVVQRCDVTEVEIDGRSCWVRPVGSWVLESGNVVASALAESLDKPLEWAVGFFFGNTELSLELRNVIAGISGFDD